MKNIARMCAVALLSTACGSQPTSVRLTVVYEDAWALDALEVTVGDRDVRIAASREVLVRLAEPADEVTIEIAGARNGTRIAFGQVTVRPTISGEVRDTIALSRIACGDWCSEGASACDGDGVVTCEHDAEGCTRWSSVSACPSERPFCSLGVCGRECVDECAEGDQRCEGPGAIRGCGQADSDPCLDWLPANACADGEHCESGRCASGCAGECELDAVRCQDSGISRCADRDADGCAEWGPSEPCIGGESCEAGVCVPVERCSDECTANACDGTTLTQCGNYDLDPCLEPSPGLSCLPADPCLEGGCSPSGCQSAPRVCAEPPASQCVDGSTLRIYESTGSCMAGACEYAFRDEACPSCPACDACAGVSCASPPPPSCVNASTLRTYMANGSCAAGACSYPFADAACTYGCAAGACNPCTPSAESCNGIDDDCNGSIDVRTCGTDIGACVAGTQSCGGGSWGTCSGVGPISETCNGLDDDCDGMTDDSCGCPGWTFDVVDPYGIEGDQVSLAVDGSGGVHIAYVDGFLDELRHTYREPGSSLWSQRMITSVANTFVLHSLAVDATGRDHLAYYRGTGNTLWYASRSTTGTITTEDVAYGCSAPSIAADANGGVHVVCQDFGTGYLAYHFRDASGTWTARDEVSVNDTASSNAVTVDSGGTVHYAYLDWFDYDLYYVSHPPGGTFSMRTVDTAGDQGGHPSIAVDGARGVHISYENLGDRDLKYAYKPAGTSTFVATTLDSAGDVGLFTSIDVDGGGGVHIAYYDATNRTIKYAYRPVGGAWSISVIESADASDVALDVDAQGGLHVAYTDRTLHQLRHAYRGPCS